MYSVEAISSRYVQPLHAVGDFMTAHLEQNVFQGLHDFYVEVMTDLDRLCFYVEGPKGPFVICQGIPDPFLQ